MINARVVTLTKIFHNINASCRRPNASYNIPLMTNKINEKESKPYNVLSSFNDKSHENFINKMTNDAI